jgi:hypothetical protein
MNIICAPKNFDVDGGERPRVRIFLAGSIEMGKAEKWQDVFAKAFSDHDIDMLNPRRDSFDDTIENDSEDPKFKEQVEWEQKGLEEADIIALYLDPNTKSPISLLELGLFAHSHKIFVCCPEGFWKKGNVDIICDDNDIPRCEKLEELISIVLEKTKKLLNQEGR